MDEQYYKWHKLIERQPTNSDADEKGRVAVTMDKYETQELKHYTSLCFFPNNHDPEKTYWFPGCRPPLPVPPEKAQAEKDKEKFLELVSGAGPFKGIEISLECIAWVRADERKRLAKEIMDHIDTEVDSTRVSRGVFVSLIEIEAYLKTLIS